MLGVLLEAMDRLVDASSSMSEKWLASSFALASSLSCVVAEASSMAGFTNWCVEEIHLLRTLSRRMACFSSWAMVASCASSQFGNQGNPTAFVLSLGEAKH